MSKQKPSEDETINPESESAEKANAGQFQPLEGIFCPKSPTHTALRVYKTSGRTRHCVCDDCGHHWKISGPFVDELRNYAVELADGLATADPVELPDGTGGVPKQYVLIPLKQARDTAKKLRKLIGS